MFDYPELEILKHVISLKSQTEINNFKVKTEINEE